MPYDQYDYYALIGVYGVCLLPLHVLHDMELISLSRP